MNTRRAPASTKDLVAAVSSELTPTERRIAEAVLAEPTLLAFGTVSDLANHVGTSRPTIVRFANTLGFDGYTQLQRHVRNDLSHQLARPSERIRNGRERVMPVRVAINNAITSVFTALESEDIAEFTRPLVRARTVWILSGETSQAGAQALQSGLAMVRSGVQSLHEHSYGTDLSDAVPGDTAVVFDFFRYRRQVAHTAEVLADAGVTMLAITDSPLSPLAELADAWFEIEVPAVGPFDSSVPAVAMAELLVARVAKELQEDATARIDRIEALWEKTEACL